MDILELLKTQLGGPVMEKLGGALGIDPAQAQSIGAAVLPAQLASLTKHASTEGGAQHLLDLAAQAPQGNVHDLISSPDGLDQLRQSGTALLPQLLGSDTNTAADQVAAQTGSNSAGVQGMMQMVLPLVLGTVGQQVKNLGLNASSLGSLFTGGLGSLGGGLGNLGGAAAGIGGAVAGLGGTAAAGLSGAAGSLGERASDLTSGLGGAAAGLGASASAGLGQTADNLGKGASDLAAGIGGAAAGLGAAGLGLGTAAAAGLSGAAGKVGEGVSGLGNAAAGAGASLSKGVGGAAAGLGAGVAAGAAGLGAAVSGLGSDVGKATVGAGAGQDGGVLHTNPALGGSRGMGWLWLLPLLLLVLLGGCFLLRGKPAVVAETTPAAGTEATPAAGSEATAAAGTFALVAPAAGATLAAGAFDLTGTGKAGDVLEIFEDGVSLGKATVGADGKWTLNVASPAAGAHTYSVKGADGTELGSVKTTVAAAAASTAACTKDFSLSMKDGESVAQPFRFGGVGSGKSYTVTVTRGDRKIGTKVMPLDASCGYSYTSKPGKGTVTYAVSPTGSADVASKITITVK